MTKKKIHYRTQVIPYHDNALCHMKNEGSYQHAFLLFSYICMKYECMVIRVLDRLSIFI